MLGIPNRLPWITIPQFLRLAYLVMPYLAYDVGLTARPSGRPYPVCRRYDSTIPTGMLTDKITSIAR